MTFEELKEELEHEYKHCEIEIRKIDVEMARLQGKRDELDNRKTMIWGLLNK